MRRPDAAAPAPLDAQTKIVYDVATVSNGVDRNSADVSVHSLAISAKVSGKTSLDMRMSHDEYQTADAGYKRVYKLDEAPSSVVTALEDFDKIAARLELDAEGSEISRKARIATSSLLFTTGTVDNTRLFHPRFAANKETWSAVATIAMGNGQAARGTLRYQKLGPAKSGKGVQVKVEGELSADGRSGGAIIKNSLYRVSGEQVYDPDAKEWVSGEWKVDLAFENEFDGIDTGSANGTMTITFKRLPAVKPPAASSGENGKAEG
jgi:hypothetical protein